MTDKQTTAKVKRLKTMIVKYTEQIKAIQESCPHPNAVKVPKSDTGNWDKSQDCYWLDCSCSVCFKFWREEQ